MKKKKACIGLAVAGIMLVSGCGLRYEVVRPRSPKRNLVWLKGIDFKKRMPETDKLPLPIALQKKRPELRFITLDREKKSGDLLWLNSKGR